MLPVRNKVPIVIANSHASTYVVRTVLTDLNFQEVKVDIPELKYKHGRKKESSEEEAVCQEEQADWIIFWQRHGKPPTGDFVKNLKPYQIICWHPGSMKLTNKSNLALILTSMQERYPEEYDIHPKTWLLPHQYRAFKEYTERNPGKFYIQKEEASSCGKGIFLVDRAGEEQERAKGSIVQEYLEKPLLIEKRKFDIRLYVFISKIEPLKVHVFTEGLVRFASKDYQQPAPSNLETRSIHLTNTSINTPTVQTAASTEAGILIQDKRSTKVEREFQDQAEKTAYQRGLTELGNSRSLRFLEEWMALNSTKKYKTLCEEMNDVVVKSVVAAHPMMLKRYRRNFGLEDGKTSDVARSFLLLGYDIILDDSCRPYLLEVNRLPSLKVDTIYKYQMKRNLLREAFRLIEVEKAIQIRKKFIRDYIQCTDEADLCRRNLFDIDYAGAQFKPDPAYRFEQIYPVIGPAMVKYGQYTRYAARNCKKWTK